MEMKYCVKVDYGKRIKQILALVLVVCSIVQVAASADVGAAQIRTVNVDPVDMSSRFLTGFVSSEISYDEEMEVVSVVATNGYTGNNGSIFDNVSLTEDNDSVDEAEECEDSSINYECTFDMNELVFDCTIEIIDENGSILDIQEIITDAIITENGGLDAYIVIDGQEYRLSDYESESSIDNCAKITLLDLIKIYLVVAETAEKIKAVSNYKYNTKLEENGNGVGAGYYVYDQSDKKTANKKAGNYRFGFTTFDKVGCEVASAYNTVLALGDSERLSTTIYCFELWAIEFSIGWGHLGSDPYEIYRYLGKHGYKYSMYTSYSKFKAAVDSKSSCHIIMARANKPATNGIHTYYIKKVNSTSYNGYNWEYSTSYKNKTSLDSFNNGSAFLVGYIVWK